MRYTFVRSNVDEFFDITEEIAHGSFRISRSITAKGDETQPLPYTQSNGNTGMWFRYPQSLHVVSIKGLGLRSTSDEQCSMIGDTAFCQVLKYLYLNIPNLEIT